MWVKNNSEHDLVDGYDGIRYTFAKGESIEVPTIVCQHVFGLGDDNKQPYLARLGWIANQNELDVGLERLNKFAFSTEKPEPPSHESPVVDSTPLPIPQRKGRGIVRLAA
jgi:hypothetical protein